MTATVEPNTADHAELRARMAGEVIALPTRGTTTPAVAGTAAWTAARLSSRAVWAPPTWPPRSST